MSRFFRSADSSSESGSSDNDDAVSDDEAQHLDGLSGHSASQLHVSDSSPTIEAPLILPTHNLVAGPGHHRDLLLHALLEERCLNEAFDAQRSRASTRPLSRNASEVRVEARARYLRLCRQLSSYNLISTGSERDEFASGRQAYRDGLDILMRQSSDTVPMPPLTRLLTGTNDGSDYVNHSSRNEGSAAVLDFFSRPGPERQPSLPAPLRRLLMGAEDARSDHFDPFDQQFGRRSAYGPYHLGMPPGSIQSRYRTDFEELSILGHGGYGIVYHARNRLDNQVYAVKKVPLGATRLQRIRARGQEEVDELLLELRTLAKLSHPNIVRYYGAWIEWADAARPESRQSNGQRGTAFEHSQEGSGIVDNSFSSLHRVVTETESDPDGTSIVFEHSGSAGDGATQHSSDSHNEMIGTLKLSPTTTSSTAATVSDDTIEAVERISDMSTSIQSIVGGARFTEPTLAIHMQMTLHPMTLADFLSPIASTPNSKDAAIPQLRHCYHLGPSVAITLAVLDGLDYLHSEGIVHRDIKPANIFISANTNSRFTSNSIDLLQCSSCRAENRSAAVKLDICIGDFGLAAVGELDREAASPVPVGTETYRPAFAVGHARSPSLDIYALGVVFFELLWESQTRMERHHALQRLKGGEHPADFLESESRKARDEAMACIEGMLAREGESVAVRELKQNLVALQALAC